MLPNAATSEILKKSAFAPVPSLLPNGLVVEVMGEVLPATRVSVPPVALMLVLLELSPPLLLWQAASDKASARDKQGRRFMGRFLADRHRHFRTLRAHRHREGHPTRPSH